MKQLLDDAKRELLSKLDLLEMANFSRGFEEALNAIEELSNEAHNKGNPALAEALRWAVKEVLGENYETNN
jgi:hypothetical protein